MDQPIKNETRDKKRLKYKCIICGKEELSAMAYEFVARGGDLKDLKLVCISCIPEVIREQKQNDLP
jgi:hypothetical protein